MNEPSIRSGGREGQKLTIAYPSGRNGRSQEWTVVCAFLGNVAVGTAEIELFEQMMGSRSNDNDLTADKGPACSGGKD